MVDNTDAEGRLVLTDGLARAGEEGATHIVDIATLTGAVVRALGPERRRACSAPTASSIAAHHPLGRATTARRSGSCRSSRSTASR